MALDENEQLERPPMPIDENSVVLVSDRRTVKRFDLMHGQTSWVYQESKRLPVNGPPRLLGSAEALLVLHDGHMLIRLDPATGLKRWEMPAGTENLSRAPELDRLATDKNLYCVNYREHLRGARAGRLRAVSLEDGSRVWSCPLSGPQERDLVDRAFGAIGLRLSERRESKDRRSGERAGDRAPPRRRCPDRAARVSDGGFRDDVQARSARGDPGDV